MLCCQIFKSCWKNIQSLKKIHGKKNAAFSDMTTQQEGNLAFSGTTTQQQENPQFSGRTIYTALRKTFILGGGDYLTVRKPAFNNINIMCSTLLLDRI
jgi:hypothetical protein